MVSLSHARRLAGPFRMARRSAPVLLAPLLLILACGEEHGPTTCPPPPPPYLEPSSPANVLSNLRTAWRQRDLQEYGKLLSEDFTFAFDSLDASDPEDPLPREWSRTDELEAAECLFANEKIEGIDVSWTPRPASSVGDGIPNRWKIRADAVNLNVLTRNENNQIWIYEVRSPHQVFYFREDRADTLPCGRRRWYCTRWEDSPIEPLREKSGGMGRSPAHWSWGRIKANCGPAMPGG